jgi:hypothetical protein
MAGYTEKEVLERMLSDKEIPSWKRTQYKAILSTEKPEPEKPKPAKAERK